MIPRIRSTVSADTDLFNYVERHFREQSLRWAESIFVTLLRQKLQRYAINRRYRMHKRNQGGVKQ